MKYKLWFTHRHEDLCWSNCIFDGDEYDKVYQFAKAVMFYSSKKAVDMGFFPLPRPEEVIITKMSGGVVKRFKLKPLEVKK